MTINRQAKYLSVNDFGKTITFTDADTGKTITGEFTYIDAIDYNIELGIRAAKNSGRYRVDHDDEVSVTGTPTPPGLNLHQPVTQQDHGGQGG